MLNFYCINSWLVMTYIKAINTKSIHDAHNQIRRVLETRLREREMASTLPTPQLYSFHLCMFQALGFRVLGFHNLGFKAKFHMNVS
jgi:hypothetical protein